MFFSFFSKIKIKSSESSSADPKTSAKSSDQPKDQLLPVSVYLRVFVLLLLMIFINIGISKLPLPSFWMMFLLITVATVQTLLVALFFMELIHEDKFYSFIFGSAVLFMLLFFIVSLGELRGRDFFDKEEGIQMMRGIDHGGDFAPGGPHKEKKKI
jgi:caa(3)-type oxidase subunit IV